MASITLYDFNQLTEQDQHALVHSEGTFLKVIQDIDVKYVLYGLESFYVELRYHVPTNSIKGLTSFKRGIKLDKYLERYKL